MNPAQSNRSDSVLVTGGAGFVGSHLAARLLRECANVTLLDNFSRIGATQNVTRLRSVSEKCPGALEVIEADVRNAARVAEIVRTHQPDAIFHLAGQVAMTTSVADPRADFETNAGGTINLLEAVRHHAPEAMLAYASSNKVYGNLAHLHLRETALRYTPSEGAPLTIDESAPLEFHTPYGCSKGAADQYVLDYARSYGLRTVVFRHSTIYGGGQHATFDQGWVGWFCRQAMETQRDPARASFTIAGDGKQVRDLLHVDDAVAAYLAGFAHAEKISGEVFNLGGGAENSMSLLELFAWLEERLDVRLRYERLPWRLSDQKYFVADNSKAAVALQWSPRVAKYDGLDDVLSAIGAAHTSPARQGWVVDGPRASIAGHPNAETAISTARLADAPPRGWHSQ